MGSRSRAMRRLRPGSIACGGAATRGLGLGLNASTDRCAGATMRSAGFSGSAGASSVLWTMAAGRTVAVTTDQSLASSGLRVRFMLCAPDRLDRLQPHHLQGVAHLAGLGPGLLAAADVEVGADLSTDGRA